MIPTRRRRTRHVVHLPRTDCPTDSLTWQEGCCRMTYGGRALARSADKPLNEARCEWLRRGPRGQWTSDSRCDGIWGNGRVSFVVIWFFSPFVLFSIHPSKAMLRCSLLCCCSRGPVARSGSHGAGSPPNATSGKQRDLPLCFFCAFLPASKFNDFAVLRVRDQRSVLSRQSILFRQQPAAAIGGSGGDSPRPAQERTAIPRARRQLAQHVASGR